MSRGISSMPYIDEVGSLYKLTDQHELSDTIEDTTHASHRHVPPLSCLGAALVCMIFALTGFGGWAGGTWDSGNTGAIVSNMLADSNDVPSLHWLAKPLKCCARGSGGQPGICLLGDPNGICCGSELALLCGAGSLCYTNGEGNPYCCGKHTSGCAHVCLDNSTRDNFMSSGGVCNPVSPQGFNADGTILYVEAPWDGTRMSYHLDGTHNITYVDPPIRLGAGDFTMTATVIPRNDSVLGFTSPSGDQSAVLFRRIKAFPDGELTGYEMGLFASGRDQLLYIELYWFFFFGDRRLQIGRRLERSFGFTRVNFNLSVPIRANVPISVRIIRQGLNFSGYVDNVPAKVDSSDISPLQDVDTELSAPLEISPRNNPADENDRRERTDFPGSIRDLSITSAAEAP